MEYVTAHHHRIGLFLRHDSGKPVEKDLMLVVSVPIVKHMPYVPVACM